MSQVIVELGMDQYAYSKKMLDFPEEGDFNVVFVLDKKRTSYKFNQEKLCYFLKASGDNFSEKDIQEVLAIIIDSPLLKEATKWERIYSAFSQLMKLVIFLFALFLLFAIIAQAVSLTQIVYWLSFSLLALCLLLVFIASANFIQKRIYNQKIYSFSFEAYKKIEGLNETRFKPKYLEWEIGPNFSWLELNILMPSMD